MFNPISHNVIRQALRWSNLAPTAIHTIWSEEYRDGTSKAIYEVHFDRLAVEAVLPMTIGSPDEYVNSQLYAMIDNSFCDDIKINSVMYDLESDSLITYLRVHLEPLQAIREGELSWLID